MLTQNKRIPLEEVNFHPMSIMDDAGRLFWYQGLLYRGINRDWAPFYRELIERGTIDDLVKKGLLVHTEVSNLKVDNFELVLKHDVLPFVSYPHEWCAEMLRQAALRVLDLEIELRQRGLILKDSHPWNVLFNHCNPIYVDVGSIVSGDNTDSDWKVHEEFCRFFWYPLQLMAHDHERMASLLLQDEQGVLEAEVRLLAPNGGRSIPAIARWLMKGCVPVHARGPLRKVLACLGITAPMSGTRPDLIRTMRRQVESLEFPYRKTPWSEYYASEFPLFVPCEEWTEKHKSMYAILSQTRPHSVLDIGSNRGWYTQLAAKLGSNVVAFDVDNSSIGKLYDEARGQNLRILPLKIDFRSPTPFYFGRHQWAIPTENRLQCEMVFGLALVHHLVFKQYMNFQQIVDGLAAFSSKSLVVEFIPREDIFVREWWSDRYSWYTLEEFKKSLYRFYRTITTFPSFPEPRLILLCEK